MCLIAVNLALENGYYMASKQKRQSTSFFESPLALALPPPSLNPYTPTNPGGQEHAQSQKGIVKTCRMTQSTITV